MATFSNPRRLALLCAILLTLGCQSSGEDEVETETGATLDEVAAEETTENEVPSEEVESVEDVADEDDYEAPAFDRRACVAAFRDFTVAYSELETAVTATPHWWTKPGYAVRVRGLAAIAVDRARRLQTWVPHGMLSQATIDLAVARIRDLSLADGRPRPTTGANPTQEADSQLKAAREERVYRSVRDKLELLENYMHDDIHSVWLVDNILLQTREELLSFRQIHPESLPTWKKRVDPRTYACLDERVITLLGYLHERWQNITAETGDPILSYDY